MAINVRTTKPLAITADRYQGISPLQQQLIGRVQNKFDTTQQQLNEYQSLVENYAPVDTELASSLEDEYRGKLSDIRGSLKNAEQLNEVSRDFSRFRNKFATDPRLKDLQARKQYYNLGMQSAANITDQDTRAAVMADLDKRYKTQQYNDEGRLVANPTEGATFYDVPTVADAAAKFAQLKQADSGATTVINGQTLRTETSADGIKKFYVQRGNKWEKIDPKKLNEELSAIIMSDPKVEGFLEQAERIGLDRKAYEDQFKNQIAGIANLKGFNKDITTDNVLATTDMLDEALKQSQLSGDDKNKILMGDLAPLADPVLKNSLPQTFSDYTNLQDEINSRKKVVETKAQQYGIINVLDPKTNKYQPLDEQSAKNLGLSPEQSFDYNQSIHTLNKDISINNKVEEKFREKIGITPEAAETAIKVINGYRDWYGAQKPEDLKEINKSIGEEISLTNFPSKLVTMGLINLEDFIDEGQARISAFFDDSASRKQLNKALKAENPEKFYERAIKDINKDIEIQDTYTYKQDFIDFNNFNVKDYFTTKELKENFNTKELQALGTIQRPINDVKAFVEANDFVDDQNRPIPKSEVFERLELQNEGGGTYIQDPTKKVKIEGLGFNAPKNNYQGRLAIINEANDDEQEITNVYVSNDLLNSVGEKLFNSKGNIESYLSKQLNTNNVTVFNPSENFRTTIKKEGNSWVVEGLIKTSQKEEPTVFTEIIENKENVTKYLQRLYELYK